MGNPVRRRAIKVWGMILATALLGWQGSALAWGSEGHRLVARIAEAQLTPQARQSVDALLALEPGATLESISTWADEHKTRATSKWHYVNFPRGTCDYEPERDCLDGSCVVAALDAQIHRLKSANSPEERLRALKYVVHLIGDIHQPLHSGWEFDKGGNKFQIQAFGRGSNLHALWDSGLIGYYKDNTPGWSQQLMQQARVRTTSSWSVQQAAEESCIVVSGEWFYPARFVGAEYADRFKDVLSDRLMVGGNRLAQLLNRIWAGQ